MTGLLGPDGRPIYTNKKEAPPVLGEKFGVMNEPVLDVMRLPGGGAVGFNLDALTLSDFRQMLDHYQINNSLTILTFFLHQMEWHVECENKKMVPFYEEQLASVWSRLVRGMSQAFWAGFSPNIIEWENDIQGRRIVLGDIKDQTPELSLVNWKQVDGYAPPGKPAPRINVYDGIKLLNHPYPVPVSNTFWYPLLMQNSNYYGKKLLRSAFQPWFFSQLIHLFSNRYFERFGEPTPVGRAPYDEEIDVNGKAMRGNALMASVLQQLRNRAAVVLPNDKTIGSDNNLDFDYQIEYLESQMRGADFERYLTRLDEEMSLSLFTPILMMRTADVGSYNLGTQHGKTYDLMMNAISGDWSHYINKYLLRPLRNFNDPAGANGAMPRIKFVKLGKTSNELLQAIIVELLKGGRANVDVRQVGELAGLSLEQVDQLALGGDSEGVEDDEPPTEGDSNDARGGSASAPRQSAHARPARSQSVATAGDIVERIKQQVRKSFATDTFGNTFSPSMGYRRRMEEALKADGLTNASSACRELYDRMDQWLNQMITLGRNEFGEPDVFVALFEAALVREIEALR